MKLYAPKYYKRFQCIADKCKHSCCVGWEIDVDNPALEKYNSLSCGYATAIRNTIDFTDTPHFILAENDKCPHLNESGLCKIILNVGEDCLCDICREHPRFYNFTNRGKEVGIGMSCEEACRLILDSDDFDEMYIVGEIDGEPDICEFDALEQITKVYEILKDTTIGFASKIDTIYDYFDIFIDDERMPDLLSSLEYLDEAHRELFIKNTFVGYPADKDLQLARALGYFVFRHCSEACNIDEFYSSLSFSVFCAKLIANLSIENDIYEVARIVSEEIEYSEENSEKIKLAYFK